MEHLNGLLSNPEAHQSPLHQPGEQAYRQKKALKYQLSPAKLHSAISVLTFDGRGVSGHSNHTAIYKAVSYLASIGNIPDDCSLLSLLTIGVLRKYLSFLELPISWLLPSDLCCVIGSKGYIQAKRAMLCHRTQLLWFRYLYIWFSRYMIINTFQVIDQGPKNLKIY
ncbi:N-acetylglucosaminyl-phosphatidylinositol de-N-acetylase [Oncorhynchus keta]|uniref:N-acetylglucosaminyl-phosphatidylinositol de-N-acetylase n=1 Tax=Oncorhynchus keta TaxID=8018 RepID=UPI0015FAFBE1|nr:N-acetylglucosaminyl-phosphatidylinositol de-N-acetylase [Oncorhynchus keta]